MTQLTRSGPAIDQTARSRAETEPVAINAAVLSSPLGSLWAAAVDEGVCLLEFHDRPLLPAQRRIIERRLGGRLRDCPHPWLDQLAHELKEYFHGRRRRFSVPLIYPGTAFQVRVWQSLLAIPYGQTRSYGELADLVGSRGGQRAVGRANGMNRIAIVIPCHRVITSDGGLGGYGGGLRRKRALLELEGALEDQTRLPFSQAFPVPTGAAG